MLAKGRTIDDEIAKALGRPSLKLHSHAAAIFHAHEGRTPHKHVHEFKHEHDGHEAAHVHELADMDAEKLVCVHCSGVLELIPSRGWVHEGGAAYYQRCDGCGWRGSVWPPLKACPGCGQFTPLKDDHVAEAKRS